MHRESKPMDQAPRGKGNLPASGGGRPEKLPKMTWKEPVGPKRPHKPTNHGPAGTQHK